jgi:DNA-binding response OmpR family regulator
LACLARKAGTPVSRDEILAQVWRLDPRRTTTRTIDVHVSRLRKKLEDDVDVPKVLITVHGKGYMLLLAVVSSGDAHPSTAEADPAHEE